MATPGLEKLYNPCQWSLRGDPSLVEQKYEEITSEESKKAVKVVPGRLDVSYGNTEAQKIDLFGEDTLPKDAPIFVFLHGGYWAFGSRQDSRYFVPPFFKAGILCCVVGYDLISESVLLPDIISGVQKAFGFILDYASKRGSRGVYICGHSAGAHLVTMALSPAGQLKNVDLIKGVIPMCGLFELKAVLPTSNAATARLTEEIAETCSPLSAVEHLKETLSSSTVVLVVAAEHDSPAFVKQSEEYYKAVKAAGIKTNYELIKGEDHTSVVEKLCSPDFILTKKLIEFVTKG